ncbi:uncharacterized protein G2W53_028937 [Senna tora]|uniref:Uncharacterized protein n=1 Tax=Senna tora TaxID=362788 RepID=A0A834WBA3_9FABA|nr:uncharacterized protein G2W53_028937 [Senna tora]
MAISHVTTYPRKYSNILAQNPNAQKP